MSVPDSALRYADVAISATGSSDVAWLVFQPVTPEIHSHRLAVAAPTGRARRAECFENSS